MNHNSRYTLYAMAVLGAGGIALWAGVSPLYFLLLLVCPLMMFFMMRGMHGGPGEHDAQQRGRDGSAPDHPENHDLGDPHERTHSR